jgi:hypothetical protein
MTTIRRLGLAAIVLGSMACEPGRAGAAFVTYTETGVGSGTLGASSFTNALITFTQTSDTNSVILGNPPPSGVIFFGAPDFTSTVNVAGLGTASITVPTFTQSTSSIEFAGVGLGDPNSGQPLPILLGVSALALRTYDLRSSIGPITGTTISLPLGQPFATNLGPFVLASTAATATFQATVVPEPSSLALCVLGVAAVASYGRRR